MNLTKYTVVTSDDFGKFEDRVNQLLGDGWELQGGVCTSTLPDTQGNVLHVQWSQALILPARAAALEAVEEVALPLPQDFESIAQMPPRTGTEPASRRRLRRGMLIAKRPVS